MGKPAARLTDMHVCPMVTPGLPPIPHVGGPITGPGAPTVLIGGMPASVMGDMCVCVGPPDTVILGSTGVMFSSMPAARMGDSCAHGGTIVLGCPTVLIGEVSVGAAAAGFAVILTQIALNAFNKVVSYVKDTTLSVKFDLSVTAGAQVGLELPTKSGAMLNAGSVKLFGVSGEAGLSASEGFTKDAEVDFFGKNDTYTTTREVSASLGEIGGGISQSTSKKDGKVIGKTTDITGGAVTLESSNQNGVVTDSVGHQETAAVAMGLGISFGVSVSLDHKNGG